MAVIEVNRAQMDAVLGMLNGIQKDADVALRRAINKTATAAKTEAAKGIGGKVTLKSKKIKEFITVIRASNNRLSATVRLKGALTPAILFTNRQLTRGVSLKIFKGDPPDKLRHSFYATMPSGHVGIFERKALAPGVYAGRLPIEERFGPSITTVYEKTPGLSNQIEQSASVRLLNETESQVNFILSKYDG